MHLSPDDERQPDQPPHRLGVHDTGSARDTPSTLTVPVIDESLHVDKVEVDRGGFRITKRVDVHDELVEEVLRHERVRIERVAIDRPLVDGEVPAPRQEGDTLIVPVVEEVLVTEKRLMLVEEVRITRIHGTRAQSQQVALRKESIEVERLGAETSVIRSSHPPSDRQPNDPTGPE